MSNLTIDQALPNWPGLAEETRFLEEYTSPALEQRRVGVLATSATTMVVAKVADGCRGDMTALGVI